MIYRYRVRRLPADGHRPCSYATRPRKRTAPCTEAEAVVSWTFRAGPGRADATRHLALCRRHLARVYDGFPRNLLPAP